MRPRDDRRRQLATLAALLWTFGYEIGPAVHVSLHARLPAHSHEAGETDHDHAHSVHGHAHGHQHRDHHGAGRSPAHSHSHSHSLGHSHSHSRAHSHAQPHPRSDARERLKRRGRSVEPAPATHGAHSLEHRGVAATRPPPATPKVPPASLGELRHVTPLRSLVTARIPDVVRARGPPSARAPVVRAGTRLMRAA